MSFDLLGETASDARVGGDGTSSVELDAPIDVPTVPVGYSQKSATVNGVGPQTITMASASTAGSMLVLSMGANGVGSLVLPPGWNIVTSTGFSGACYALIAYYPNNPGGITDVMYMQPSGLPSVAVISEISGVTALDAFGTATGMNPVSTQTVATSGATSTDRGIAVTTFCEDVNTPTYTSETGWTNIAQFAAGAASTSFTTDYKELASPVVVTESVTTSPSGKYAAVIATFR